jgi:membrane associated rhomboid family serine protease
MGMTTWVLRLLVANVAMYFITAGNMNLMGMLALIPVNVPFRPWTVLTYMFLHGSTGHLLFNMLALFFFGPRVEARLGGKRFLRLYLLSGLCAALFSVLFAPRAAVVGASGAVYGVLLAFAMFWPREPIYIWMVLPIQSRWLIAVMTFLSLYSGMSGARDGVAHFAHLGGFVGGFLYLRWIDRARRKRLRVVEQPNSFYKAPGVKAQDTYARWAAISLDKLHELNRGEVEQLLVKAKVAGVAGLTPEERAFLDRMANAQGIG